MHFLEYTLPWCETNSFEGNVLATKDSRGRAIFRLPPLIWIHLKLHRDKRKWGSSHTNATSVLARPPFRISLMSCHTSCISSSSGDPSDVLVLSPQDWASLVGPPRHWAASVLSFVTNSPHFSTFPPSLLTHSLMVKKILRCRKEKWDPMD